MHDLGLSLASSDRFLLNETSAFFFFFIAKRWSGFFFCIFFTVWMKLDGV